jgi:hypothetical protein
MAFVTQNDTFTFYFKQNGATVDGWGFWRPTGALVAAKFSGAGTLSGGQLDLSLQDLDQMTTGLGPGAYYLRGPVDRGRIDAAFSYLTYNSLGYDTVSYPITLRPVPPITSELAGTWALTSSTGASATPGSILHDTIIVNGSGGAWRHRDGVYTWDPLIATRAIWWRNGSWLVLEHESPDLSFRDSLLAQSSELQRTTINYYGTRVDHYTRVSAVAELP